MSPLSPHQRTAARLAALLGGVAIVGAVALHDVIPHPHPEAQAAALLQMLNMNLLPGQRGNIRCADGELHVTRVDARRADALCDGLLPTASPLPQATATPTLAPSVTRTVTPTSVPMPTGTPPVTPTIVPTAVSAMHEGVPICTNHSPTVWHALVERNADGSIRCTHAHEHHDDPSTVNDIFGAPGAWFGTSGQSISYPWQTFAFPVPQTAHYPLPTPPSDPTLLENAAKHYGYKWYVKRDLPCLPFLQGIPPSEEACFVAYRVQVHSAGHSGDVVVRFHSFSMEALVDRSGVRGIARGGGWLDTGTLVLLANGPEPTVYCPPLATNPPQPFCGVGGGTVRTAAGVNMPAPHLDRPLPGALMNWYATHLAGLSPGPAVEDWGPTDGLTPNHQHYYPASVRANNSQGKIENMMAAAYGFGGYDWQAPILAGGRLNGTVYRNRHGQAPAAGCSAAGLDCIPFVYSGFPVPSIASMNFPSHPQVFGHADHDVLSPVTSNSLIRYPN
jgi:hypothetical protein